MEILVLHPGALGDIILSLPALSLLRHAHPHSRLTLAGNVEFAQAVSRGYADRVLSLSTSPLHHLYSTDPLPAEDLQLWKSFDLIVSWTGAGDSGFAGRLSQAAACVRISNWRPDLTDKRHVARIFVESLYPWIPLVESIPRARIEIEPAREAEARAWMSQHGWTSSDRLLAIHPGAGSSAKRWKLSSFRCLALRHLQQGDKLLIAEGPADTGLSRDLSRALEPQRTLLAESLPLDRLAALFAMCCAYVGNDSGVSHLAAGLGVPSVVLFGPTSAEQWAPLGDRVTVLQASGLDQITPDQVWNALREIYD